MCTATIQIEIEIEIPLNVYYCLYPLRYTMPLTVAVMRGAIRTTLGTAATVLGTLRAWLGRPRSVSGRPRQGDCGVKELRGMQQGSVRRVRRSSESIPT